MFILALFMVFSGFYAHAASPIHDDSAIPVQAIGNKVDNKGQQPLRSLFDSISRNDKNETGSLRVFLERESQNEQKAFDTMKNEIQLGRQRNAYRQRDSWETKESGDTAAVLKRDSGASQPVEHRIETLFESCARKEGFPGRAYKTLTKTEIALIVGCMNRQHENVQKEVRKFKGFTWKIVPRVFFDDIESLYKPRYDKYNDDRRNEEQKHKLDHVTRKMTDKPKYVPLHTTPADYPDGRDPRAVRMRQKYDFWDWLTTQHADDDTVKKILEKMEKKFRSMEKPPIPEERELTEEEKGELEKFRKKTCKAIGFALESASFILHGYQAVELFEGELEHLNIYGDEVDPYLVPVLNAVVPLTKEGVESATFMKTE